LARVVSTRAFGDIGANRHMSQPARNHHGRRRPGCASQEVPATRTRKQRGEST
jgi:hypothetical protein